MKTSCSIRDVARVAEVAPSTVSRVLNNRMGNLRIAEETRKKILSTAKELKYTPNVNAKRLFSKQSGVIGLLVPSFRMMGTHIFEDNHLTRILSGLEKGLGDSKYSLLLLFSDQDFIAEKRYLTLFREHNIDGLLIWGAYENESFWSELIEEKYPYLFLSNVPAGFESANFISSDYEKASYQMTRYVLENGRRKIVWGGGKTNISINYEQERGIARALAEFGMKWEDLTVRHGLYKESFGHTLIQEVLREAPETEAIIFANHGMALGATKYLQEKGIPVPQKLGIVSCDSFQNLDEHMAHITRMETQDLQLGENAARTMIELINQTSSKPVQIRYDVKFIAGKTI